MASISIRSRIGEIIQRLRFMSNQNKRLTLSILDWEESIRRIQDNSLSLCRVGDGELLMVYQYLGLGISDSTFQEYDKKLGERLYGILQDCDLSTCIVGLPLCMFGGKVSDMTFGARYFWERFSNKWLEATISIIPDINTRIFADTNLTRFYADFKTKAQSRVKINKIKQLWNGREILIVEGCKTRFGVGNDLISNTISVRRILVPARNAFSQYDRILSSVIEKRNSNELVLIAAGMTATVLAYDLSKRGIQAFDIGHLDIEYEWLNRGALKRTKIEGKFVNEADSREIVADCDDPIYRSQIVVKVL